MSLYDLMVKVAKARAERERERARRIGYGKNAEEVYWKVYVEAMRELRAQHGTKE